MPPIGQRPTAVGSHRSNILPTTTDFSNLGILNSRAPDDVFRSIQLRHPRRTAEPTSTGRMFFGPSSHHTSISTGISSAASASIKQPDVIPKDLLHDDTVNECRGKLSMGVILYSCQVSCLGSEIAKAIFYLIVFCPFRFV